MRIGRVVLFVILLTGVFATAWFAGEPALREYRAAQRTDDLGYVGMIAENAELLLTDTPLDTTRTLGQLLTPLFDSEEYLSVVRIRDARGKLLCEVARNIPDEPQTQTRLTGFPAVQTRKPPRDLLFQLQQLVYNQSDLSARMSAALNAGKGDGMHNDMYVAQDSMIQEAELLRTRVPRLGAAIPAMQEVVEALTHTDAGSLYLAQQASQEAEASLSLALEDLRAVTDFPGRLPDAIAAASPADWLPLRARRITVPLYAPTGTRQLIAPAGTAEVIFADRPTAQPQAVARRIVATPVRWIPPAALLLGAVMTLVIRKRRRK